MLKSDIQKDWYNRMMADPIRYRHYLERIRRNYKPRIRKVTVVACRIELCPKTFKRMWPNNNQQFCKPLAAHD
jgi:hypothetical protein